MIRMHEQIQELFKQTCDTSIVKPSKAVPFPPKKINVHPNFAKQAFEVFRAGHEAGARVVRVGNCSKCNYSASVNTPRVTPTGKLICYRCQDSFPGFLIGIEQSHASFTEYVIKLPLNIRHKNISVVCSRPSDKYPYRQIEAAWTDNGRLCLPLRGIEFNTDPFILMPELAKEWELGIRRCTGCHSLIHETKVAGYPLFAGLNCSVCWTTHQAKVKKQRVEGKICRMCRQPYLLCCC